MDRLIKRLEDLRTLETELWTRHREENEYDRTVHGIQYGAPTIYGRAAEALSQLVDDLEAVIDECLDAEAVAYATGQPWGEDAVIKTSTVLAVLNESLSPVS